MRYQGRCEQIWENGCLLASWSKSHADLFLCIFPSHQHVFTGFLSRAHHLLCESGETRKKAWLLCWRSLMAQPQERTRNSWEGGFPVLPAVSGAAGGSHSLTVSRETKTWSSVIWWLWRDYLTQSGCSININWIDDSINKWMSDGKEVAADVPRQRWCSAVWREEGGGIRTWLRRFLAHVQLSTLDSASGQIFNHCQEMEAQAQSSNDWREKRNSNKWPKYI